MSTSSPSSPSSSSSHPPQYSDSLTSVPSDAEVVESQEVTADNAAATSETQAAPTPASNAGGAVAIAMQYVGRPYVSGAAGPDAFDCSGLVQYVYAQMGISLPRTAQAQGSAGTLVSAAEAQPGDIVYFGHHVGIYAGDGKMIDAGTESTGVVYRDIYETPIGYVRVG